MLLSMCGFGMGIRKRDRGGPRTPTTISQCCKCSSLCCSQDLPAIFSVFLKGLNLLQAGISHGNETIHCMFTSLKTDTIYVKEWLGVNLYTTYSGTFSKTYAGENQMHM